METNDIIILAIAAYFASFSLIVRTNSLLASLIFKVPAFFSAVLLGLIGFEINLREEMRTEFSGVDLHPNGKYSVTFRTFKGTPGSEYLASVTSSAAVFDTEDQAYDAGVRALNFLEDTGRFPNMLEKF